MNGPVDDKLREIAHVVFPRGISRAGLLRLGRFDRVDVSGGRTIASRGERARSVFVLLDGRVDVGLRQCVAGDVIGDAPALSQLPWPHAATVVDGARLLVIPTNEFADLLSAIPELNAVVMRSMSARLVTEESRPITRRIHRPSIAIA